MPRSALTDEQKIEYMIADLPYQLDKLAAKRKIYQKDVAATLNISKQAYCARKGNEDNGKPKNRYSYGDLVKAFHFLKLSDDEILKLMKL